LKSDLKPIVQELYQEKLQITNYLLMEKIIYNGERLWKSM